jgi:TPR repeat protein
LNGEGVPKDLAVAKEWFQIASTQGYEPSQSRLQQIELLDNNKKVQQDQQEKRSSRWSLNFFKK